MKFYIDTADIEEIRGASRLGMVDGITTNPSLIAKTKKSFGEVAAGIAAEFDVPINLEAVSEDAEGIIKEAERLSAIHRNVVVKIPMAKEGIIAVKALSGKGIKTNVTLVFSANQALIAAKAGASYVSPFIGRLDDIGENGMRVVSDILEIYRQYGIKTEVIVASIRHPMHIIEAAKMGAHIATIPFEVLNKMFLHPLTDIGIKKFADDWKKVAEAGK